MAPPSKSLVILLIQFLREHDFKESSHLLEQESGYLDVKYVEELAYVGDWDEVENYLYGFTNIDENRFSYSMFSKIKEQKCIEALGTIEESEQSFADVLAVYKDKKSLKDIRKHSNQATNENIKKSRKTAFNAVRGFIKDNPVLCNNVELPTDTSGKFKELMMNWFQLFDQQRDSAKFSSFTSLYPIPDRVKEVIMKRLASLPQLHVSDQLSSFKVAYPIPTPLMGPTRSPYVCGSRPASVFGGSVCDASALSSSPLSGDPDGTSTDNIDLAISNEKLAFPNQIPRSFDATSTLPQFKYLILVTIELLRALNYNETAFKLEQESGLFLGFPDLIPRSTVVTLSPDAGSTRSMEFHPVMQTLLLVGTSVGDVVLWDISKREKIAFIDFKIWHIRKCSKALVKSLANKSSISVNRVTWSPDGDLFGVAYSQHLVHLYSYGLEGNVLRCHLEIDAHVGSVNDLAFFRTMKGLCLVTCGNDKVVKVWDASTGAKKNIAFEHESPVSSIYPYQKEGVEHILATLDGKMKVWSYDDRIAKVTHDATGSCYTRMAYRTDSSGPFKGNDSDEGFTERTCGCQSSDDDVVTPQIQFDNKGLFFAVTSKTGGINILATSGGMRMLHVVGTKNCSAVLSKTGEDRSLIDVESEPSHEPTENCMVTGLSGNTKLCQCGSMRLGDALLTRNCPVLRLIYSHLGESILALPSNGVHSLWKWQKNYRNITGHAIATECPQQVEM